MSDLKLSIRNYKLIEEWESEHKDARILLITGKNERGKTSMIRGLIENITARSITDDPVSHGKEDGSKTFILPDKDGNLCTVHHDFSEKNKKGSFYAIDHLGKKIKEPTKIRELLGTFEELTVETFYGLQQSAEGRRKIIKNYFYPLMKKDELEEIQNIDTRVNRGGDEYEMRSGINATINVLRTQLEESKPSREDKIMADEYDNIKNNINTLQDSIVNDKEAAMQRTFIKKQLDDRKESLSGYAQEYKKIIDTKNETIAENNLKIEALLAEIETLKVKNTKASDKAKSDSNAVHLKEKEAKEIIANLEVSLEKIPDVADISDVESQIKELESMRDIAMEAKNKVEKYDKAFLDVNKHIKKQEEMEKKIVELKERKKDILANSSLPAGLSIEEDNFTWNGFNFNEAQISESSAMLVIAEILCNIVQAKIVYIGKRSSFDKDRFKKLVEIAEKHGKIPVLEQVVDDQQEIKIITEIQDV